MITTLELMLAPNETAILHTTTELPCALVILASHYDGISDKHETYTVSASVTRTRGVWSERSTVKGDSPLAVVEIAEDGMISIRNATDALISGSYIVTELTHN